MTMEDLTKLKSELSRLEERMGEDLPLHLKVNLIWRLVEALADHYPQDVQEAVTRIIKAYYREWNP